MTLQRVRATERDEEVLEVVLAEHGAAEQDRPCRRLDLGMDSGARDGPLGRCDLGVASRAARAANDGNGYTGCVEFHVVVEIQMVSREVCERCDLEIESVGPMHREAMARHLEHQMRRPIVERLPREA